ncbi:dTDP-4-dehydrorhamnose 3,5-epimerase [Emticicia sp. BO119]|uniref:dTDP-4-dehydrorhamnose 3,5-epimerase n=1 Tax=Emticicia sp. BO119 TaxID=2757768 RepID=UPI0015F11353|nr:dTDP-4-dehydrorhamnose 3,5-epimerase [Emticicia sp. BO119]MBA4849163.1 dTDP-4-dehydrorhamnose 3,5-epimerase [Emticicia sp. BO119]
MEFRKTSIEGLIEIFPRIFGDERGYFLESYHKQAFSDNGIPFDFVQDNQSLSSAGVLRGLHFQREPHAQGKLVRVIIGKALDVAVDLRPGSPTFGKHEKFLLDAKTQNMVFIPAGFAHGFLALEQCLFTYKCTNFYNKASEGGIIWNDPDLAIDWGIENPNISQKDLELPRFNDII